MSLKLKVSALVEGEYKGVNDLGTPRMDLAVKKILDFAPGVAAGQLDKLFADSRTLAASATESLDLAGSLTDPLGQALSFAKVNVLMVRAAATNANDVVIGGAASNGFTSPFGAADDKIKIRPGGCVLLFCDAGYAVTAGTGDQLQIANGGAGSAVAYDIVLAGRSA